MKTITYQNGNAKITLDADGTRIIEYDDILDLDYPLNIDIRVSTKCSFGLNPTTGNAVCSFCHESAQTNGKETDFEKLKSIISPLPAGIELAIGANNITTAFIDFLEWCQSKGFVCNITINQGHLKRDHKALMSLIEKGYIKGLGVSYRANMPFNIPDGILAYNNTVFHTIIGIDDYRDVISLKEKGVKKILILGEKDFGFNLGKVDTSTKSHKLWLWNIKEVIETFEVTSFDNLALEQLKLKRLFKKEAFEEFYQNENSFYIDAVAQIFKRSSRTDDLIVRWDRYSIPEYYKYFIK